MIFFSPGKHSKCKKSHFVSFRHPANERLEKVFPPIALCCIGVMKGCSLFIWHEEIEVKVSPSISPPLL